MSGFVAPTRAIQARPRFSRIERQALESTARASGAGDAVASDADVVDQGESVSKRRAAVAARLQSIRERWAQTTFYLFDGDSWR